MRTANQKSSPVAALSRGAAAARAGCNIETVRYYEQVGLLPAPPRSEGGHRLYQDGLVRRLLFIRRARALGFTLDEIRGLLRLVDGGSFTCAQVEQLALAQIGEIHRKIADLQKLEAVLRTMAAQCSGSDVPECPIIDALFAPRDALDPLPRSSDS
ncbi:MAG TPA: helix-turn-helix domain-containing protein [Stellaceae bacterium]|nr:helix-turn-helix domain-containing protein [Stellaceae bacterium]